jgi:hypothetical protein
MKRSLTICLLVAVAMLVPSLSMAALLDPATLHIGTGAGTNCDVGCAGDPNVVPTNVFDIYQNSGGAAGLLNPVLLIIGIPNDAMGSSRFLTNPIGSDTFYNPYSHTTGTGPQSAGTSAFAANQYGLTPVPSATGANGYFGSFTASSPQVYQFLSLTQPTDASNNFGNWAGADLVDEGVSASSFGIYVFALSDATVLGANGLINIKFGSALPKGTYAIAYGEDNVHTHIYDTPFTEAGLTGGNVTTQQSAVPEPASLALLGSGLVLAGTRFRRKKKSHAD